MRISFQVKRIARFCGCPSAFTFGFACLYHDNHMDADTFSLLLRVCEKNRTKMRGRTHAWACMYIGGNAEQPRKCRYYQARETVSNERYSLPPRILTIFMRLTIRSFARKLKMSIRIVKVRGAVKIPSNLKALAFL